MSTKIIANPHANRGRCAALLPRLTATLTRLGIPFDLSVTEAPGQAVELARQAALEGYRRVVAVGGDGTCHEVVNGLFAAGVETTPQLGVIPAGSGNDFAHALGVPSDVEGACAVLKEGAPRPVDLGRVTVDGRPRLFANNVGLGFDGEVTVDLRTVRHLHGFWMYLWSVFRVIASGRWPYQMTVTMGDRHFTQAVTLITVANGTRSGGGFLLTPSARVDDGVLDVCYADGLSKAGILALLPRTFNGSHVTHRAITMATIRRMQVTVPQGVPGHVDGELLCEAGREFTFEVLPGRLQAWRR